MKAFGKILGLVLLGLLLIIVALGFALTHLFDPNDYKEEIRQIARDKAHIELTLNGDIGWSLFPWLGDDAFLGQERRLYSRMTCHSASVHWCFPQLLVCVRQALSPSALHAERGRLVE